jgi:hypothetical protein
MRAIGILAALLVTGCATVRAVDAPTALNGHELDTALNLYGRWDEQVVLQGRPHYIWRRAVLLNGQSYFCELRTEIGYRNVIKASVVEGYPAACGLFTVQYSASPDVTRRDKDLPHGPKAAISTVASAAPARNYRPVGSPTLSASASANGTPASATAPSPAGAAPPPPAVAGPGGP